MKTENSTKKKCVVCKEVDAKYKCSKCREGYCSVACYKLHKETSCQPSENMNDKESNDKEIDKNSASVTKSPRYSHEDEQLNQPLSESYTKAINKSAYIKEIVKDTRLQEVIKKIDSSKDRVLELEKALLDPNFSAFAAKLIDELSAP